MVRTRIAPSPTGFPHIGTVFQALLDYVYAKQQGGKFIIRLEDTDRNRLVPGAEEVIYSALEWAGVVPDEGPKYGGEYGPYRQSERLPIYQKYIQQLIDAGHAYYCFCSSERLDEVRKQMQAAGQPPMYDRHCRHLDPKEAAERAQNEPHVVRMKVPDNETIVLHDEIRGDISFESNVVDDQVILKTDGFPTYHSAVVIDDHLMKITHVVRGEEWISSTPKHILLYRYFGWDVTKFIHTPLLRNPDKSKLSKRHGHASVTWYREQGYLQEAVINFLATRIWNHPEGIEIFTVDEFITHFDFAHMHIQAPIADLAKLDWINGQWIRRKSDEDLLVDMEAYRPKELDPSLLKKILPLIKERLVKLSDLTRLTHYFYEEPVVDEAALLKEAKMTRDEALQYIEQVAVEAEKAADWTAVGLEQTFHAFQERMGIKPRPAFMTIRLALTGESATPPLFDVMAVLGKETVVRRLRALL